MKTQVLHSSVFAICLVLLVSVPVAAQATGGASSTTTPLNTTIGSPCAGELIDVTGQVHVVQHTTSNEGTTTTFFHLNTSGIGVGQSSGQRYVFTQSTTQVFNTHQTAFEFTLTEIIQVISAGPGNNFRIRALFRATVDATGRLTVELMEFERICD